MDDFQSNLHPYISKEMLQSGAESKVMDSIPLSLC